MPLDETNVCVLFQLSSEKKNALRSLKMKKNISTTIFFFISLEINKMKQFSHILDFL